MDCWQGGKVQAGTVSALLRSTTVAERTSKRIKYQKAKKEEVEEEPEEKQEVVEPVSEVDDFLNMSDAQLMVGTHPPPLLSILPSERSKEN